MIDFLDSVNIDGRAYRNHLVELGDILVEQAYAAVTDRMPDGLRPVRAVYRITVPQVQAVGSKNPLESPLVGTQGGNQHLAAQDDVMAVRGVQDAPSSVGILLDDIDPDHFDD